MTAPFISVVMPVYGVEAYLEESVRSVLAQTEGDFEIILVDDCSKDESPSICDALARGDERISVLHLAENVGLSGARNAGFERAAGDYVFFMDPDDTVEPRLFADFMAAMAENPADLTVFGINERYYDMGSQLRGEIELVYGEELRLRGAASVRSAAIELEKRTFLGYAWNKIYSAAYLRARGIVFKRIELIEDICYNVEVFRELESLNVLNSALYNYRRRTEGSLTGRFIPDYFALNRLRVEKLLELNEEWDALTGDVMNTLANLYVRYTFSAIQRNCDARAKMRYSDRVAFLRGIYEDELFIRLIPHAGSAHLSVNIMSTILRGKKTVYALIIGRAIYIIKEKLPILFSRLKQHK